MFRIESKIDTKSKEYKENFTHMKKVIDEYKEKLDNVREGGPKKYRELHTSRGKLLVRERLEKLFDRNTPFLELTPLAAYDMYDNEAPSAGVITGIGVIHGREVLVVANDATVKGGTYFPMTIKKHVRAQEIARVNRLPCIYLVDSGGIFLPHQSGTFADKNYFGRIFYNQARLSALGIPQISIVMGSCTAGGAYVPAMSDETVIVRKQGTIFIGGRISGVSDYYALNDKHALEIARNIVETLDPPRKFQLDVNEAEDPYYDPEEIYGIVPQDLRKPFNIKEVIARIVDGSRFQEFKELYGQTLVCGFARIMGYPVGILANNGVLFSESSLKGAHFVTLCSMRKIPIVFLQNITGFIVGKQYEHGGIAKDGAKLVHAVANADVPKFTMIVGGSYGAGNYAMCGRAYEARLLWMWANARISVMGGEQAANVLLTVKIKRLKDQGKKMTKAEQEKLMRPILERYDYEASPYFSTARIWDDGILDPLETREALALGISMSLNAPIPDCKVGIFRM